MSKFARISADPAWLMVGDRLSLFYLQLDGTNSPIGCRSLDPGIHILENRPIEERSGKVDRARGLLGDPSMLSVDGLIDRLVTVLADHEIVPDEGLDPAYGAEAPSSRPACVHGETYGTRSSTIVLVPETGGQPRVLVADGRPCSTPFRDESYRWTTVPS
ncbi:MAG: NRDE family protein [Thermoplasmata archaeon]|nr:NRDE family protein [Thermoplasmata archaeon]